MRLFSPIYMTRDRGDVVAKEMLRLKVTPGMPGRAVNGVDLTPEQHAEYVRLAGEPAKRMLDQQVRGRDWEGLPDYAKAGVIEGVIRQYRAMARAQLVAKYPEIAQGIIEKRLAPLRGSR